MIPGEPSTTARWVAFARGLGGYESPPLAADPHAVDLLHAPWSTLLRAAARWPRATRMAVATMDTLSQGRSRFMSYRTRVLDDVVRHASADGIEQVVILGAGLDARAWRLPELATARVFEVDHPDTQDYKRARMGEGRVTYVPVDFEKETAADALVAAGLDVSRPSVVLWEGVAMYLPPAAIDATLATMRPVLATGSRLAISYSRRGSALGRLERELVGLIVGGAGERFRHHEDPPQMRARLDRQGFRVLWDEGHPDWAPRLLGRRQGWDLQRIVVCEPAR
ncbi:MAG: SAM-dependent methyltransferase [Deltaproteobacteria bacterium]|nr:SAM-dependent methyltransferase [Deltaproteobacteria bacterium]